MSLLNKKIDKTIYQFRGKLACFRYVGVKEIMLIQDPEIYDPEENKWVKCEKDHFWMDCTNKKVNKKLQGRKILFQGMKYTYTNSTGVTQIGIDLKYPNLIRVYNDKKSNRNK